MTAVPAQDFRPLERALEKRCARRCFFLQYSTTRECARQKSSEKVKRSYDRSIQRLLSGRAVAVRETAERHNAVFDALRERAEGMAILYWHTQLRIARRQKRRG